MTVDFELDDQPYTALNGGPEFTFSWQVVPTMLSELTSDDPKKEKAVADAIFAMKKLDIAELQRAFDGA